MSITKQFNFKGLMSFALVTIMLGSCTITKQSDLARIKSEYKKVEIIGEVYLIRISDEAELARINTGCFSNADDSTSSESILVEGNEEGRHIIERGLKPNNLKKFLGKPFYLTSRIVVDTKGKTVLSTILDTNLKLSDGDEFKILHRLLQTRITEGGSDYSCMIFKIDANKN